MSLGFSVLSLELRIWASGLGVRSVARNVQVPKKQIPGSLVVLVAEVLGKYMIIWYLDPRVWV